MANVEVQAMTEAVGGVKVQPDAKNDLGTALEAKDEPKRFPDVKSPQDPIFNSNNVSLSTVGSQGSSPQSSAKSDSWSSPNKSGETEGAAFDASDETGTTLSSDRTPPRDNKSPREDINSSQDEVEAYETSFGANTNANEASPDLMITGNRLKALSFNDEDSVFGISTVPLLDLSISDPELHIDASGKNWIKVVHGDKEKMIMVPPANDTHLELGLFEISETLAATFGVADDFEIVGLSTTAVLFNDEATKFKHHGEVVIPLSYLASGLLKDIAKGDDVIPTFRLVTKKLCNFDNIEHEIESKFDVSSTDDLSFGEEREYTEAFVDLMENSDAFTPVEKNLLLRFGINEIGCNILFRAAFRVAAFTCDQSRFVTGLKAVAEVLLGRENADEPPSKTIFGLVDFISCADELLSENDLTAEQYVSVVDAIFSSHPEVEKMFELHFSPDFLLACDDEDLRGSLLIKDIMALATSLPPLHSQEELSDAELKYAINIGLHNFAASLSDPLPDEFRTVLFHMFSSGDEMVLNVCKEFIETDDNDVMERMITREWEIYQKNRDRFYAPKDVPVAETSDADSHQYERVPDLLVTAVAALVDLDEMSEDTAAALVASTMRGNALVLKSYDTYMEKGDTDQFLKELKMIASDDQFASSRSFASPAPSKFLRLEDGSDTNSNDKEEAQNAFKEALEIIKMDNQFGPLEITALRLAAVRKDVFLSNALQFYVETRDYETLVRDLSYVASKTIHETEIGMES